MKKITQQLKPLAGAAALLCACASASAATIVVQSRDPAGVGFNDTTPVAPVGGNMGTTLGQQRMNVYLYVAQIWGAALESSQTIYVNAGWQALDCTSTLATLGSASAWNYWHDFAGGKPGTWYPQALANKLAGTNLSAGQPDDGSGYGNVDIKTQFNINLGNTGCLDGATFYLGLDSKITGNQVNFMTTLLHELGHGLGFSLGFTSSATGQRANPDATAYDDVTGLPTIWEGFMYDNTLGKTWLETTSPDQRKASAINTNNLAWNGPGTVAAAAQTLSYLTKFKVTSPAQSAPAFYGFNTASFGKAVGTSTSFGYATDTASQVCAALPANSLTGKVAIVDRGTCSFVSKAKVVQDAGAVGMIVVNNVAGDPLGMSGTDATVTIPSVIVSQADGAALRAMVESAKKYGTRTAAGMVKTGTDFDPSRRAGADAAGRPLLYTPAQLVGGSSVSHWDVSATPNLLMEPLINADLTTHLVAPWDLTLPLLKDIGW